MDQKQDTGRMGTEPTEPGQGLCGYSRNIPLPSYKLLVSVLLIRDDFVTLPEF